MPRRKAAGVMVTPAPSLSQGHKRQRSGTIVSPLTATTLPTRSSKRNKTTDQQPSRTQSTTTKSKYFEHHKGDEEETEASEQASESGYEDEQASTDNSLNGVSEEEEDEYSTEQEEKKPKRGRKSAGVVGPAGQPLVGKSDLWREGVKTGLGPGKAVFIEKPKARGDGGIQYVPERIHPNTMEFLKDLKKNNDRIWMKAHDADYRASWKDFETFVDSLTEKIAEIDETIPELPPKDLVFRVYRDVRFSSDPTPYKPHFSAAWSRTGRKGPYACYYVHIQPGERCFVGSGLWHPDAQPVRLLRTDIDQTSHRIRSILTDAGIRKHIFGGIGKDEQKAIQAFCKQNEQNMLKTKPKGYEVDNPNIALLRLRNFTIGQKISDQDILSPKGLHRILELIRAMKPFVVYLNSVVMPDHDADVDTADDSSSSSSTN